YDAARRLELGDRVVARRGLAARLADLVDDLIGRLRLVAAAVDGAAEVVHDHRRAFLRHQDRDAAADAASRAGHDGDLSLQVLWHDAFRFPRAQALFFSSARGGAGFAIPSIRV